MMTAERYDRRQAGEWNEFAARSKNGTFLLDRGFMDYHSDRFADASLVFRDGKGAVRGLLPANCDESARTVVSHGGLTYGGLLTDWRAVQADVNEMLALAADFYRRMCAAQSLVYKPAPYIYHTLPAQEDLYALHRMGAVLKHRAVSSAVPPGSRPPFRKERVRQAAKARRMGLEVARAEDGGTLRRFHEILSASLRDRHNAAPAHSAEEMELLMRRFPDNIHLYVARRGGDVYAGSWVFITRNTVHAQYLVNSEEGRGMGAEDIVLEYLINDRFNDGRYFDLGISTEDNGRRLNEGLIHMKEGFGARAVCYDTYALGL